MDRIASVIEGFIRAEHITGAAVRVYKKNARVYDQAFGFLDLEKKMPVTADSIYRLCSMSKPVTGICVMKLVEEGKLSLDDPISNFVPAFRDIQVVNPDSCGYHSGAAGMLGSLEAYSAVAKMLLDGGIYNGVRILK